MTRLPTAAFLLLSLAGWAFGQSYRDLMAKVREIKLLESTRNDVRRILANYNTSESNDHFQRYYNDDVNIRVHFSDGTCSDDAEDDDDSVIWKVSEWKVTRVELELERLVALKDAGFDLSQFVDEQRYRDSPDLHIHHDKARGIAIETGEDDIEMVIFFPPSSGSKKLCEGSTIAKEFYSRKSWFAKKLQDRVGCVLVNKHADVEDILLSATEIEATSNKTISVTTVAVDPENDVLTYNYKVSAGRIVGNGAKIVWDLTGIPPGAYSITVGVDDGGGIVGQIVTKTVTIR